MLRLWLTRDSASSLQEQLSKQLLLGFLSGAIPAGERLPSVRQLARQYGIHSNTVSLVYRDLRQRGWLHFKHGSGVFVRPRELSPSTVTSNLILVDPEPAMARILAAEIEESLGFPLLSCGVDAVLPANCTVLFQEGQRGPVGPLLHGQPAIALHLRSMPEILAGLIRPPQPVLVAVVTESKSFRQWAASLLGALGYGDDVVILRNPAHPNWQEGLGAVHVIGADLLSARLLRSKENVVTVRLLNEESVTSLGHLISPTA